MEKKQITEADHLEKEWLEEARRQTEETLPKFINHLMNDYEHDYGTCIKAVAAAMLGTFWAFNHKEGFTGFQVGFIPWIMISEFWGESELGRKVLDFDEMMYPQYENQFKPTIKSSTFKKLQDKIRKKVELVKEGKSSVHPLVLKHWESVLEGKVPFGYVLE